MFDKAEIDAWLVDNSYRKTEIDIEREAKDFVTKNKRIKWKLEFTSRSQENVSACERGKMPKPKSVLTTQENIDVLESTLFTKQVFYD